MSIIVGGGTGFVGRNFARLGAKKGYKIISVSRKASPNAITWEDISQNGLPADCHAVVSMSGEPILQPFKRWTDEMKEKIRSSRVAKTELLSQAISQASKPPKVFVSLSGIAYYKPDANKEYTENDHIEPYDWLSQMNKEWEAAATLPPSVDTRTVNIRTGVVLGKDGGMIQNIKPQFYLGGGGPIGSGDQWFSWIHVKDMAGLIWHSIENSDVKGILNGTAPHPVHSREFTSTFASTMWRPHLFPFPSIMANFVFGSEAATVMLEGQNVTPKKTMESGFQFEFPDVTSACKDLCS